MDLNIVSSKALKPCYCAIKGRSLHKRGGQGELLYTDESILQNATC